MDPVRKPKAGELDLTSLIIHDPQIAKFVEFAGRLENIADLQLLTSP